MMILDFSFISEDKIREEFEAAYWAACAELDAQGARLSEEERMVLFRQVFDGSRFLAERYLGWYLEIRDVSKIDVVEKRRDVHSLTLIGIFGADAIDKYPTMALSPRDMHEHAFCIDPTVANAKVVRQTLNAFWRSVVTELKTVGMWRPAAPKHSHR